MAKDAGLYAAHKLEAIGYIESDLSGHSAESFGGDRRTIQLVERNLEIISEASRRLPDHLRQSEPEIDWPAIAGIGNILRHDYHRSQPAVLWRTCEKDLPPLKDALRRIRHRLARRQDGLRSRGRTDS